MAPTEMAWVQFPRDISIATDLWQVGATLVVLLALISLLPPPHQEIIQQRVYNIITTIESQRLKKFTGNGALDSYIIGKVKSFVESKLQASFFFFLSFPPNKISHISRSGYGRCVKYVNVQIMFLHSIRKELCI
jgi:hypothetical protein